MKRTLMETCLGVLMLLGISGCTTDRVDLLANGTAELRISDEDRRVMAPIFVYQSSNTLMIAGDVRHVVPHGARTDSVLIEMLDPEGSCLVKTQTPVHPGYWTRRSSQLTHFRTEIPIVVPTGSVIRLTYKKRP
jgi:hypothetical protein